MRSWGLRGCGVGRDGFGQGVDDQDEQVGTPPAYGLIVGCDEALHAGPVVGCDQGRAEGVGVGDSEPDAGQQGGDQGHQGGLDALFAGGDDPAQGGGAQGGGGGLGGDPEPLVVDGAPDAIGSGSGWERGGQYG